MNNKLLAGVAAVVIVVAAALWFLLFQIPVSAEKQIKETLAALPPGITSDYQEIEVKSLSGKALIHKLKILVEDDDLLFQSHRVEISGSGNDEVMPPFKLHDVLLLQSGVEVFSADIIDAKGITSMLTEALSDEEVAEGLSIYDLRADKVRVEGARFLDGGSITSIKEMSLSELERGFVEEISVQSLLVTDLTGEGFMHVGSFSAKKIPLADPRDEDLETFQEILSSHRSIGGFEIQDVRMESEFDGNFSLWRLSLEPIEIDNKSFETPVPTSLHLAYEGLELDADFASEIMGSLPGGQPLRTILSDYELRIDLNPSKGTLSSKDALRVGGLGQLETELTIGNLPFEDIFDIGQGVGPEALLELGPELSETISLVEGKLSFEDWGLVETSMDVIGEMLGMRRREMMRFMNTDLKRMFADSDQETQEMFNEFVEFLDEPNSINIRLSPRDSVDLETLQFASGPQDIVDALGLDVKFKSGGSTKNGMEREKMKQSPIDFEELRRSVLSGSEKDGSWVLDRFSKELRRELQ